jgi:hypothetical protein
LGHILSYFSKLIWSPFVLALRDRLRR